MEDARINFFGFGDSGCRRAVGSQRQAACNRQILHRCNGEHFSLQLRLQLAAFRGPTGMNKKLLLPLILSALGLTGCVAVPYGDTYAYAPAPVVAPSVSFGYYGGYYRGGHRYHGHRGHRHRY
jgi:hypothetical protein